MVRTRHLAGMGVLAIVPTLSAAGCLDRPVSPASPNTQNIVIEPLVRERIEKIDLLFMLDNSISMADKQETLADAVPELVQRLVQPRCVDPEGNPTGPKYPACPAGTLPEFRPVTDIHVGVISSSLGSHGGDVCSDGAPENDRAHLMPAVRPDLAQDGNGFLWWKPGDTFGDADVQTFSDRFQEHVRAAGEAGCGYEASLESWYRFLIDPAPPERVEKQGGQSVPVGVDEALLAQRRDFLRPDSLVAIVMLSDENDCSIRDTDVGWYAATTSGRLARSTSACAADPNDPCCRSCASIEPDGPPAGCAAICDDAACQPECGAGEPPLHSETDDKVGLRCFRQKQRFGIDFLYPTRRYVNALAERMLCKSRHDLAPEGCPEADLFPNPLYAGDGTSLDARSPSLVFLAGIVGVPWQDIATAETVADPNELAYLSALELSARQRWSWITAGSHGEPEDPLMRESTEPRQGAHPSGDPALTIAGPEATAGANAANGHEWRPNDLGGGNPGNLGDLQYACTYPLTTPRECSGPSCDCTGAGGAGYSQNKPLCQDGAGYSSTQRYAKAYPGLRQLEVLRDYGDNSIVASICPKTLADPNSGGYGYNPAVDAIADKLAITLGGRCLPRPLAVSDGVVPCRVVEATLPSDGVCSCSAAGRAPLPAELDKPSRRSFEDQGTCGAASASGVECSALCLCEVLPYSGAEHTECQNEPTFTPSAGWCYVDPDKNHPAPSAGTAELVGRCPSHARRLLRFEPTSGATAIIACQGAAFE